MLALFKCTRDTKDIYTLEFGSPFDCLSGYYYGTGLSNFKNDIRCPQSYREILDDFEDSLDSNMSSEDIEEFELSFPDGGSTRTCVKYAQSEEEVDEIFSLLLNERRNNLNAKFRHSESDIQNLYSFMKKRADPELYGVEDDYYGRIQYAGEAFSEVRDALEGYTVQV